jgi:hypothetical protein
VGANLGSPSFGPGYGEDSCVCGLLGASILMLSRWGGLVH